MQFPKRVYVEIEKDGDDEYLVLHEDLEGINDGTQLAVYAVVDTGKVNVKKRFVADK